MVKEAIILAGGKGTRLSSVVHGRPKPMALVNNRPFLEYVLDELSTQGIKQVVLSVGYKAELIKKHFQHQYKNIQLQYAEEEEPLGTGGGIKQALSFIKDDHCLVLNGDTLFCIDLVSMAAMFLKTKADIVIAIKPMTKFDRYGTVTLDSDSRVVSFHEKTFKEQGLINGGAYLLNVNYLKRLSLEKRFSFEKEILEKKYKTDLFYGFINDNYFIDIGIPEDYHRAKNELK